MTGNSAPRIPVTLLTGFLGAGKTSLLRRYLADPRTPATAVIINELGRIGIDQSLVAHQHANSAIIELTTGCLCCSAEGDVRATLIGLIGRRRSFEIAQFTRVIIETTGIADPVPVAMALASSASIGRFYRQGPIVTVVDAVIGDDSLDRHAESRRQVQIADRIIISKSDLAKDPASRRDLERLRSRLADLNPLAAIDDAQAEAFDPIDALIGDPGDAAGRAERLSALSADTAGIARSNRSASHLEGTGAYAFEWREALAEADVADRMGRLVATLGHRLLRAKGLIRTIEQPERPMLVQVVGTMASPVEHLAAWPDGNAPSHLVVIVEGASRSEVATILGLPQRSPVLPAGDAHP